VVGGALLRDHFDLANNENHKLVRELADRAHVSMITARHQFWKAESLMSYGAGHVDLARRAARYVDEVLRGAKPTELPFQFKLIINLKVAKAFDLTVPSTMLATADEVIE
jgi:putative tryptophan/tyrosine transport system substrate-binding protein